MMLVASKVGKSYHDGQKEIQVLKSLDFQATYGSFSAIVGPSGAGKSTLLHILGGLDLPSSGHVFFEGEDIYRLNDVSLSRIRNERVGFVFQFYHLLPEFTVLENVLMPVFIKPPEDPGLFLQIKEYAEELLKRVGLEHRQGHFPSQLSGGEQQRAAIVRALINHPALLLCDEPTGNLDSRSGSGIVSLIREISRENKMTTVMVTHNLEIARNADRIYRLEDGVLAD